MNRHLASALDPVVKRFAAGSEVSRFLRSGESSRDWSFSPDAVTAAQIPSVALRGTADRVLAEIDQDGFAFAIDPADESFFNRRATKLPRKKKYYPLTIVLREGLVCVRKQFRRPQIQAGARKWVSGFLGVNFYNEAAALLRMRSCAGTPQLRFLDLTARTIYMDYIRGESLKQQIARAGTKLYDLDLDHDPVLAALSREDRTQREFENLSDHFTGPEFLGALDRLVEEVNRCGVTVADIKLEHVIVGEATGALHWLDFEWSRLDIYPRWEQSLDEQWRDLRTFFRIDRASAAHS